MKTQPRGKHYPEPSSSSAPTHKRLLISSNALASKRIPPVYFFMFFKHWPIQTSVLLRRQYSGAMIPKYGSSGSPPSCTIIGAVAILAQKKTSTVNNGATVRPASPYPPPMALSSSRSIQIGSEKSLARDDASKQRRKMALALIFLYFGLEFSIMSGENGHSRPLLNAPRQPNGALCHYYCRDCVIVPLTSYIVIVVKLFSFDATIARARFSTAD